MKEPFAPPGERWEPVSPALARLRHALVVGVAVVLLAVVGVLSLLLPVPAAAWVGAVVLVLLAAPLAWVLVGRNARWWGYAERDADLYIRHGAFFRTLVVVPYGRMQLVDVNRGPVARLLGLAELRLVTAAATSNITIPGLPEPVAAEVRDLLIDRAEERRVGL